MSSIFIGIIGALALIILELHNAPVGYESEDGFHFGAQVGPLPIWRA